MEPDVARHCLCKDRKLDMLGHTGRSADGSLQLRSALATGFATWTFVAPVPQGLNPQVGLVPLFLTRGFNVAGGKSCQPGLRLVVVVVTNRVGRLLCTIPYINWPQRVRINSTKW